VILSGILVNILNPKLTIFFLAFLPQFFDVNEKGALPRMMGLIAVGRLADEPGLQYSLAPRG